MPGTATSCGGRACLLGRAGRAVGGGKGQSAVDGRNPAPPNWNDDSLVNTNKQWFPMVLKWCRISSIHSMAQSMVPRAVCFGVRPSEVVCTKVMGCVAQEPT